MDPAVVGIEGIPSDRLRSDAPCPCREWIRPGQYGCRIVEKRFGKLEGSRALRPREAPDLLGERSIAAPDHPVRTQRPPSHADTRLEVLIGRPRAHVSTHHLDRIHRI